MDKKKRMAELKEKGLSYQSIGNLFGISRQRVHQILSGYQILNRSWRHKKGWYAEIKSAILERDDYKCQRCDSKENLLVHHQDSNDRNNDSSNLIILCNNCHLDLHRPRKPRRASSPDCKEVER